VNEQKALKYAANILKADRENHYQFVNGETAEQGYQYAVKRLKALAEDNEGRTAAENIIEADK